MLFRSEAVRSVVPSHTPYAELNEIWKRDNNPGNKILLDAAWKPYLAGKGTLSEALVGLLK